MGESDDDDDVELLLLRDLQSVSLDDDDPEPSSLDALDIAPLRPLEELLLLSSSRDRAKEE